MVSTLDLINAVEKIYASWGNIIIFFSSFIETLPLGFLIPGSLIIAIGGFYSFGEKTSLVEVVLSGALGMMCAFLFGYLLGRKTGFAFVKKFHQEKNAEVAKSLLDKQGPVILTTSLLGNLTRFWIAYIAGSQKFNIVKFLFYSSIAALTWNSLFVTMGYLAGSERTQLESGIAQLGIASYGLVIIALVIITWNIKKEYKVLKKGAA